MKKLITISAIILFVTVGCTGGSKPSADDIITVDVMASYPEKELILQDFMEIEYIPLETASEFITMAYVQYVGQDVIVVRNRNRSSDGDIFFFDRNGKGLKKINRQGQGGEEYTFLLWVILDEDRNEVFVNDHYSSKVFVYDYLGNFKRSFATKEGVYYDQINNFDPDNLICHDGNTGFYDEIRSTFLIVSKQDGSITKEPPIPYEKKKTTLVRLVDEEHNMGYSAAPRNQELIPYRNNWILVEPSSDTIYQLQSDYSLTPFIARTPSIQVMEKEIFLFPGVLTDRYYFMQTVKKEYDFATSKGFPRTDLVYDKQEKAIFRCIVYNDDFLDKKTVNMVYGDITLVNNKIAFIQKMEAYELVEAYKKGALKGRLKEIAAELDEESNPVIMLAKPKD
ncbi:MAG: 6-bladed beta-propeller [Tannerellaceae bacterium]|nr:6-bladed beta-propeller [Tannerellaceae bacterium]